MANVNFLRRHRTRTTKYNRLLHLDRGRYVLERMFTKFSEITQYKGHYAVQSYSRSPILVPIESSYTTSY